MKRTVTLSTARKNGIATLDTSIIPMINVVFLLLIFFLLTAQIAPPDPIDVSPPTADASNTDLPEVVITIAADGLAASNTGLQTIVPDEILADLAPGQGLAFRADADLPATSIAVWIARAQAMGAGPLSLVVVEK